jgi:hypothetical protein
LSRWRILPLTRRQLPQVVAHHGRVLCAARTRAHSRGWARRNFGDNFEFIALPSVSLFDSALLRILPPRRDTAGCEGFSLAAPAWRDQDRVAHMRGLAMRISTARVERSEAMPAGKERLTVVVISVCLVLALLSFGMVAIS